MEEKKEKLEYICDNAYVCMLKLCEILNKNYTISLMRCQEDYQDALKYVLALLFQLQNGNIFRNPKELYPYVDLIKLHKKIYAPKTIASGALYNADGLIYDLKRLKNGRTEKGRKKKKA